MVIVLFRFKIVQCYPLMEQSMLIAERPDRFYLPFGCLRRHHRVDFDPFKSGVASRNNPVDHPLQLPVSSYGGVSSRVESIQGDVDYIQPGHFEISGIPRKQDTIGRHRYGANTGNGGDTADEFWSTVAT